MLAPINSNDPVISVRDVVVVLNNQAVLDHVSLDVVRGEVLGFVGASGTGKTVLMRTILGLLPKRGGTIEVLGVDLGKAGEEAAPRDRASLGSPVPARRAVFLADGDPKRSVSDARVSQALRPADGRDCDHQAGDGRTEA